MNQSPSTAWRLELWAVHSSRRHSHEMEASVSSLVHKFLLSLRPPSWSFLCLCVENHDFAYLPCLSSWSWGILQLSQWKKEEGLAARRRLHPAVFIIIRQEDYLNERTASLDHTIGSSKMKLVKIEWSRSYILSHGRRTSHGLRYPLPLSQTSHHWHSVSNS